VKKKVIRWIFLLFILTIAGYFLPACAPSMAVPTTSSSSAKETLPGSNQSQKSTPPPTSAPAAQPEPTQSRDSTQSHAYSPTPLSLATSQPQGTQPAEALQFPTAESRIVELEYPSRIRLGNSDIVRVALIPNEEGYTISAEFPEHPTQSKEVVVPRPAGYDLYAIARLDGATFEIAPQGEQSYRMDRNEQVTWRWSLTPRTAGTHRLALSLRLRWEPQPGASLSPRESIIFSRGLQVEVSSILGMTEAQAGITFVSISLILLLFIAGYLAFRRGNHETLDILIPNPGVVLEPLHGSLLPTETQDLLRALFSKYARVLITAEFQSGYSGSRTWLVLPVHKDGRRDAQTIVKIGPASLILAEFKNYETFVKDTLPPVTARIQQPPAGLPKSRWTNQHNSLRPAALRYTFIGQAGHAPTSLRQALLVDPDPAYLKRLFETFGPNWWMQRRPSTFRLCQEYDERLPAHFVVQPDQRSKPAPIALDGKSEWARLAPNIGSQLVLRHFARSEPRADGQSYSLEGYPFPGQSPLRVRWLAPLPNAPTDGSIGRLVATRRDLLSQSVAGLDRFGLPDPLDCLPYWLDETISGSQSVIHGDLNLENILIGPGGLVWLIDFARTRLGHPLSDFAHLQGEIIAQVIANQERSPKEFLAKLESNRYPLISALEEIAFSCLANPSRPQEYRLGLAVTCLGMLKYSNISSHSRHCLYLTASLKAKEG
jgi:hypothetical protein